MFLIRKPSKVTIPAFIMGCGRSGTTMLLDIFYRDYRVDALGENDPKIAQNFLLDFDKIPGVISNAKAPVIVMKPILNSFDAAFVLKKFIDSKVIWFIRDYSDMVASSIKKFGNEVPGYMKDFILYRKGNNWVSNGIAEESHEIILSLDTHEFNKYDWMALIWWSVNRTIVIDSLNVNDRFRIVYYDKIVKNPENELMSIYNFIGLKYRKGADKYIHAVSVGKGSDIELHPQVRKLCKNLTETLCKY
jgi:hypothetical protein